MINFERDYIIFEIKKLTLIDFSDINQNSLSQSVFLALLGFFTSFFFLPEMSPF